MLRIFETYTDCNSNENGGFIEKISIYSTKMYEGKKKSPRQEFETFLNTLKDVATFVNMLNTHGVLYSTLFTLISKVNITPYEYFIFYILAEIGVDHPASRSPSRLIYVLILSSISGEHPIQSKCITRNLSL